MRGCTFLFSSVIIGPGGSDGNDFPTAAVVGGCVAAVVAIIVIAICGVLILYCCYCKDKGKDDGNQNIIQYILNQDTVVCLFSGNVLHA